jgi:hypothetical protein
MNIKEIFNIISKFDYFVNVIVRNNDKELEIKRIYQDEITKEVIIETEMEEE